MSLSFFMQSKSAALTLIVLLSSVAGSVNAQRTTLSANAIDDLDDNVSEFILSSVWLGDSRQVDLTLRRVEPVAADATIRSPGVAPVVVQSQRRHFSGSIIGEHHHSQVSLSVGPDGTIRGILSDRSGHWQLQTQANRITTRLVSQHVADADPDAGHGPFQCGVDADFRQQSRQARGELVPKVHQLREDNGERYRVRLAYDTTARFVNQFDSPGDVVDYLADLTNYVSTMYVREINTEIVISSITLRDADEPWDVTGDLLEQFRSYWNNPANSVDQTRTIAHLVDAGPLSGLAYVSTLCVEGFDYGISQGLGNEFDALPDPPGWGFILVAHEIGHNFSSDHTHCYNPPVDGCFSSESGCFNGAPSLPGPSGEGSGTIMSYCHFRPGGVTNIGPTLGRNHPYGVEPDRVPNRMRAYVLERAQIDNPRCPKPAPPTIFSDRFQPAPTMR